MLDEGLFGIDIDGDGVIDAVVEMTGNETFFSVDTNGDGIPDAYGLAIDNDGDLVPDEIVVEPVVNSFDPDNINVTSALETQEDSSVLFDENQFNETILHTWLNGDETQPGLPTAMQEASFNEAGGQISFGGLTNGGLVNSGTYKDWLKDGVDPSELTPDAMTEIAEHMAEAFGMPCPVIVENALTKGFSTVPVGNGMIQYDLKSALNYGTEYGPDAILGSMAHEFGHNILERMFNGGGENLSPWQKELCSDWFGGVIYGLSGVSPQQKIDQITENFQASESHPPAELRTEAYTKGYEWATSLNYNIFDGGASPLLRDYVLKNQISNDIIEPYSGMNFSNYC